MPELTALRDLVREIAEDLDLALPTSARAEHELLRRRVAVLLAIAYLAVFTGRADLAAEQERALQQIAGPAGARALDAGVIERETSRGYEILTEFTRRWPAQPPAHSVAAARVAALFEALGLREADAARRAVHVAGLVNEYVFKRYWRN